MTCEEYCVERIRELETENKKLVTRAVAKEKEIDLLLGRLDMKDKVIGAMAKGFSLYKGTDGVVYISSDIFIAPGDPIYEVLLPFVKKGGKEEDGD